MESKKLRLKIECREGRKNGSHDVNKGKEGEKDVEKRKAEPTVDSVWMKHVGYTSRGQSPVFYVFELPKPILSFQGMALHAYQTQNIASKT